MTTFPTPQILTIEDNVDTSLDPTPQTQRKHYPNYAVIDVETTGLGATAEIVEISVVLLNHDGQHAGWNIENSFSTLITPVLQSTNVDNEASAIHGITSNLLHVALAPTFKEVAPFFASILHGRKLVGHNINRFDANMLQKAFNRAGYRKILIGPDSINSEWIDTYETMCRLDLWDGLPNKKLGTLIESYGIINRCPHSALGDTLGLTAAFIYMMEHSSVRQRVHAYYREVFIDKINNGSSLNMHTFNLKPRYTLPRHLDSSVLLENLTSQIFTISYQNGIQVAQAMIGTSDPLQQNLINTYSTPVSHRNRNSNASQPSNMRTSNRRGLSTQQTAIREAATVVTFAVISLFTYPLPWIAVLAIFLCGVVFGKVRSGGIRFMMVIASFFPAISLIALYAKYF